jgi:cell division protein FtsB
MNTRLRHGLYAASAVVLGVSAISHLTGAQGVSALLEKRRQIQVLDEETQRLRSENKQVSEYLNNLKADPDLQRKLVRERLHYVDEGAVDFKTPAEAKPEPKSKTSGKR